MEETEGDDGGLWLFDLLVPNRFQGRKPTQTSCVLVSLLTQLTPDQYHQYADTALCVCVCVMLQHGVKYSKNFKLLKLAINISDM